MIIAQIEGGLGSQMFGYAAARRLALKLGVEVYIDTRAFRGYDKFRPELHHLDVDATLLSDEESDDICGQFNEKITTVRPAHLHVDRSILDIDQSFVLMAGNYVSEDYFFDATDTIRRDFRRVSEQSAYSIETHERIEDIRRQGYSPVSVHVRRGDYAQDPVINAMYGLCSLEYYERAFTLIKKLVDNPWFVFFSNDTEWVTENFASEKHLITRPPRNTDPVDDMMLMAACGHNVLANSGFSFWGAWLSDNPEQVVIGPRPWLLDRSINTEDIMLRDWISLNTTPGPRTTIGSK